MLALADLITEVDHSVERASADGRWRLLGRVADLLDSGGTALRPEQIDLFDLVIQRFAAAIEIRARVDLAERLARLSYAPPGVILQLAEDEIVVARPVLAASPRLGDQDLMRVARLKGRDHMLAICERPRLSEMVTDLLIAQGDGLVRHAVAGNAGAAFSPLGTASLVSHARADDLLREVLTQRVDLPAAVIRRLVDMAKEEVRGRLAGTLAGAGEEIGGAVERGAASLAGRRQRPVRNYASAMLAVEEELGGRDLAEEDLVRFAEERRVPETIAACVRMTNLSIDAVERLFEDRDNELLVVLSRAQGWSWRTLCALLRLRDPSLRHRHQFRRAAGIYDTLGSGTAARVIGFLGAGGGDTGRDGVTPG